jgi:hypothetical protein
MTDEKRIFDFEEIIVDADGWQRTLEGDVLAVTISNEGDERPYIGWGSKPVPGNFIETSKTFGAGWPHMMKQKTLSISFEDNGGEKRAVVTIFYDLGPKKENC